MRDLEGPATCTQTLREVQYEARSFEKDALACPRCQRPLHLRTVVLPPATLDVLASLDAAVARAPPAGQDVLPTPAAGTAA
jgi:hypothetical protein